MVADWLRKNKSIVPSIVAALVIASSVGASLKRATAKPEIEQIEIMADSLAQVPSPSTTQTDGFTGQADVEVKAVDGDYQWIITIVGMIVSGMIGPVVISQFKARSDRADKNIEFAFSSAQDSQKALLEAKNLIIAQARADVERLEKKCDDLRQEIDAAQAKTLETEKMAYRFEQLSNRYADQLEQQQ